VTGRPKKQINKEEKYFARLIADSGYGPIEAARRAFGWRCEPGGTQGQRAKDLARQPRIKEEIEALRAQAVKIEQTKLLVAQTPAVKLDDLTEFAKKRLEEVRDNPNAKSQVRFQAIKALENLHNPASDANLIYRWMDLIWRYSKVHCPSCHSTFPLHEIKNEKLDAFRVAQGLDPDTNVQTDLERRLELLTRAERRRHPHKAQIKALEAPERHIAGLGAARAGKSFLLAMFALLCFLTPGVEIWILARVYEDARSEVAYLRSFLKTLFFPHHQLMIKEYEDKKTGELTLISKWGSELKIRSAKSKGSITGRELELALVAEPGWVDENLFEELRARMSSRLGRIMALGTPKGTSGFLGRMVKMTGRDEKGRVIRKAPQERLMSAGEPWKTSMLVYNINPEDNPEYVKSELQAARQELTDEEFAAEFEGRMVNAEGAKYGQVREEHLKPISPNFFVDARYVLGIDQGPVNFGASLLAYDGDTLVSCWEYFEKADNTMKKNLKRLRKLVPMWIRALGGDPINWTLTITDRDPPLYTTFQEMQEEEGIPWPTDVSERHTNRRGFNDNWRKEVAEYINEKARMGKLLFHHSHLSTEDLTQSPGGLMLHEQVMSALNKPESNDKDATAGNDKGWIVKDVWRADHVLDSFIMAVWCVYTGQVLVPERAKERSEDVWFEQKAAFKMQLAMDERKELGIRVSESDLFEQNFGRKNTAPIQFGIRGFYGDEG
jgi:hypothetical protein